MKIGICHHVTLPGSWDDAISGAAALGIERVELFVRDVAEAGELDSPGAANGMRAAAQRAGVTIGSVAMIFLMRQDPRLANLDEEGHQHALRLARETLGRSADLGADVVLVGGVPPVEEADATELYVRSLQELAPLAASLGLRLGVESGLPSAAQLALLDRIDSSTVVGDYYDTGNLAGRGMDPVEEARLRAGRITQVHVKGVRGAALADGTVDLAGVLTALKEGGFDGTLCLETAAGDDALANAGRNLAALRAALAG